MQVSRYGANEVWGAGDALMRRYGALETHYKHVDMEVWRLAAGMWTWRYGAREAATGV